MSARARFDRQPAAAVVLGILCCALLSGCGEDGLIIDDPAQPHATYYTVVVRPGDSVSRIAARYDVSSTDVADLNNLTDASRVRPGQTLRIPAEGGATRDAVLGEASSSSVHNYAPPPKPIDVARFDPHERVIVRNLPPEAASRPADQYVADGAKKERVFDDWQSDWAYDDANQSGTASFLWPVRGEVISSFGTSGHGERNDGINIAAAEGTPIHAAAAGTVTYAGDKLKGYGNLVLIQHDGGYITAYAHADSISVSRGEHVSRGQIIGLAGATGDVDRPQLHFEIRKGIQPINPRLLLSSKA